MGSTRFAEPAEGARPVPDIWRGTWYEPIAEPRQLQEAIPLGSYAPAIGRYRAEVQGALYMHTIDFQQTPPNWPATRASSSLTG